MKAKEKIKERINILNTKQKENGYLKNAELGELFALEWVIEDDE
jgi:hypothetical protein